MSETKEKVYVNSVWVEEKTFTNGSFLKLNIKVDEFIDFLTKNKNESGRVKLTIHKKQNPPKDDKSSAFYTVLDTWAPSQTGKPNVAKTITKPKVTRTPDEDGAEF